ncbi:MAG: DUF4430 domain-containing protein [Phoenicibacter congonensis]|uniref:DUF4430 domain-containing protein n=1 Tax=Phoenicibacter congonensis TaxID=1944646 RepID=A0AA43RKV4_9ACTN|nr:DUF4430 domain-containing protein [Phoenicibacter congonensis]
MRKDNGSERNNSNEVLDARAANSSANGGEHEVSSKDEGASCKKTSSSEVNKKTAIAIATALVLAAIVVLCCVLALRSLPGQTSSSQQAAEQSQTQASADNKSQNEEKSEEGKAQAESTAEYEYSYEWKSGDGSASGSDSSSEEVVPTSVTVSVSVSGHGVSGGGTFTLPIGATAYDALMACGLSVNAKSTSYGMYVVAIGGLAEKDYGSMSGWLYAVNGNFPGIACSGFTLEDGDYVDWVYTDEGY